MKKFWSVLLALAAVMIIIAPGYAAEGYGPGVVPKNSNEKEITEKLKTFLPKNWELSYLMRKVTPAEWQGEISAIEIGLADPTTKLSDDLKQFTYNPVFTLWFCPKNWTGEKKKLPAKAQNMAAIYLGENDKYKVYYLNLVKTSWPTYIEDIKKGFGLKQINNK